MDRYYILASALTAIATRGAQAGNQYRVQTCSPYSTVAYISISSIYHSSLFLCQTNNTQPGARCRNDAGRQCRHPAPRHSRRHSPGRPPQAPQASALHSPGPPPAGPEPRGRRRRRLAAQALRELPRRMVCVAPPGTRHRAAFAPVLG